MNRHDVATLGIRFAALYALFESLEYFAGGIMTTFLAASAAPGKASLFAFLVFLLPSALFAFIGIFLLFKAPWLANFFLTKLPESSATSVASAVAPSVGFAIVGLAGFIYSVPRLVPILVRLFQTDQFGGFRASEDFRSQLPQIAGIGLQIILSFLVLVKSQALAGWWQRKQARP